MRRLGFACLALLSTACAQDPYGTATPGTGGITPVLSCGQAWMGNAGFGLSVSNALGGSTAIVGVSFQPAQFLWGSTSIQINTAASNLILVDTMALGGTAGQAGAGSGFYALPLTAPSQPVMAGLRGFAQALVLDSPAPMTFAASRGLEVELTMPPLFAFASGPSFGPGSTSIVFVDPLTMTQPFSSYVTVDDPAYDMVFAHGGRTLFVARSNRIEQADFSGPQLVWSTLYQAPVVVAGLAYDRHRERLYTYALPVPPATMPPSTLQAIDVNPASATYGQPIAALASPLHSYLAFGGSRLIGVTGVCPSIALGVIDADPASSSYLQVVASAIVPQQSMCSTFVPTYARAAAISRDGELIHVLTKQGGIDCGLVDGPGVSRFRASSMAWEDFNAALPGVQPVSAFSQPAVPFPPFMVSMALSRSGSFAITSGPGSLLRLDFGTGPPGSVTPTYGGSQYYGCNGGIPALELTQDDAILMRTDQFGVHRINPITLATTGSLFMSVGVQSSAIR